MVLLLVIDYTDDDLDKLEEQFKNYSRYGIPGQPLIYSIKGEPFSLVCEIARDAMPNANFMAFPLASGFVHCDPLMGNTLGVKPSYGEVQSIIMLSTAIQMISLIAGTSPDALSEKEYKGMKPNEIEDCIYGKVNSGKELSQWEKDFLFYSTMPKKEAIAIVKQKKETGSDLSHYEKTLWED